MRHGLWMMWLWAATMLAGVCGTGTSEANCFTCGPDLTCVDAVAGGRFCIQAPNACSVLMNCSGDGGGGKTRDPIDPSIEATSITVLEDAPGATFGAPSRLVRHAGRGLFGRSASRGLRGRGVALLDASIVTSLLSYGDGGEIAFRTRFADGFTFERRHDVRGVHIVIRDFAGGQRGRVLADERLEGEDALLVRVRIEGQPRLLLLQAPSLSSFDAARELEPLQRELRMSGAARPSGANLLTPEALQP